jgi:hypothetical protein
VHEKNNWQGQGFLFLMTDEPFPDEILTPSAEDPDETVPAPEIPAAPRPKPAFWNGWDALVLLAVALGGSVFASVLCQLIYVLLQGLFHWPRLKSGAFGSNPYFVLLSQLFLYIILVGFLFLLITRKYGLDFSVSLKLEKIPTASVRVFVMLGLILALLVMLLSTVYPSANETPLERIFGQGRALYLFALFGVIVAPFTEELIFRGFLYPLIEKMAGRVIAIVVTAAIFAGLHVPQLWGSWQAIGLILFVGLVLSSIRAVTGLLTPSWIIHLAYNGTLVLVVISAKILAPFAPSFR